MSEGSGSEGMTFWDHLDVLRGVLLRIAAVVVVFGMVAFFFKEELFDVVLAPKDAGFYHLSLARTYGGNVSWRHR